MEKMHSALIPNTLLGLAGSIEYKKLKDACKDPKKSSANTLRAILSAAQYTEYGKEHHFSTILQAKTDDDLFARYQQYVPANDYEDLRPYVERQKRGISDVLTFGKPYMYATTSGTTNEPKWIPITWTYLRDVYGKMTRVWLHNFIKFRPNVFAGKIITIVGKSREGTAPDGTFYGSVSGVTREKCPSVIQNLFSCPPEVYGIEDYTARYYAIMRTGIEQNVTMLVTPNPSTIVEVGKLMNVYYDDFCNDIERGTLSKKVNIPDDIRQALAPYLKPNPERANELRGLKVRYKIVLPKHYWPNLQIVSTWKCGNTKFYADKIVRYFPENTFIQELGYFSTECRFGLVLDDTNNTRLFPHFHYYEFVAEEELESENKHFLQLHELQKGKRYCAYVTTFAGLYRYNMNDLLEVGDFFENTPTVFMIQKINGIVSMTGEKIHEHQFVEAVQRAVNQTGYKMSFFVGFANLQKSTYEFYFEFSGHNRTQAEANEFAKVVDKELCNINIEYQSKRDSFRLGEPIAHLLVKNAYEKFKQECLKEGKRDGQFKMVMLMQDDAKHEKFRRLTVSD